MKTTTRRLPATISNLILVAALVGIWLAFAPRNLGGKASYVIVNGISMEPHFHMGDLTILRTSPEYQIGDVVTYQDGRMRAYVIHRIIGTDQDRFILKGDNNSWVDAYYPNQEEIIGKLWLHIPKLGIFFKWLRAPLHLALTMSLLGGVLMSGLIIQPSKNNRAKHHPSGDSSGLLEGGFYTFVCFTLIFLGLSVLFFVRPLTRPAGKIEYTQQSQFSYSATGTPLLYDTDVIQSGEPIFPKLTCFLNIGFTYTLSGANLESVSGSHQLLARVLDEQSGWQRTIPMDSLTTFSGNSFFATSKLDLCQVVSLVNILEQETGMRSNAYLLEIVPQVTVTAAADGNQITDSFEPKLVFRFDEVHFSLFTPKGQESPLQSAKNGFAPNSNMEANTLSIFGWNPTILSMRVFSVLGLAFSLCGSLILGLRLFALSRESPDGLIRLKYGSLLVNVQDQAIESAAPLVNVTSIGELVKLAERHNTVILHMTFNMLHSYIVQCNGMTYRYICRSSKASGYEIAPAAAEVIQPAYQTDTNNLLGTEMGENELFGYVLTKTRMENAAVEETTVLRKIRL